MESILLTGGTGFIGAELLPRVIAAGYRTKVLVRSTASAERVRLLGATPVIGDILWPGAWQQEAAESDYIMHLAQPLTFGGRITNGRAQQYQRERLKMDRMLLSVLSPQKTRRVLYVGGTSYYGDQGKQMVNEDTTPNPRGWGRYLAPAIEALRPYASRGLPIVQAFPGYIYGNGSWFIQYILEPASKGKAFTLLREPRRCATMMHVRDCARALLHLLQKGEVGQRYFLVDNEPCDSDSIYNITAKLVGTTPRIREVPVWLCRVLMGDLLTESLQSDANLSNQKLRESGFVLEFPNLEAGVAEVLSARQAALGSL